MAKARHTLNRRQFLVASGAALAAACAPSGGTGASPSASVGATATPAAKTLKIGQILPFKGVYADLGNSMKRAADLYWKLNPAVAGRPVKLLYEDEANDVNTATQAARKFIEGEQVDVIMGIVPTPIAYALRDIVHNGQTIFICTNAGGIWLTRAAGSIPNQPASKSPYVFRSSFSNWQVPYPLGQWVAQKKGLKEFQMSYANYGAGLEMGAAFSEGLTKAGGKIVGQDVKPPLGNNDFAPFVTSIKANATKNTFHFYSGADAQKFLTTWGDLKMKEAGYKLYGAGFLTEQDVLQYPTAAKNAVGAITSHFWAVTLDNPENKSFVDTYQKEYGQVPDAFAVQSWDGMRAFDEAVRKTNGDTADKQRLIKALEDTAFKSPRGDFLFDKDTHNVIFDVYIREVQEQGGKFVNAIIDKIGRVSDPGK